MDASGVIGLLSDPATLLRKCRLLIAGGSASAAANGQAPISTFKVEMKEGDTVVGFTTGLSGKVGKKKDRETARVRKLGGPAKATPGPDEFNAYYVPMMQTKDASTGSSHFSLPTKGGPDFMITSKLSGCAFGVGSSAKGATLVSHIQPNLKKAPGAERSNDLLLAVFKGFDDIPQMVRKGAEYTDYASVIGCRTKDGEWKFYVQAVDAAENFTYVISKVEVID